MLEELDKLQEQVGLLVNWVSEMKTLVQNPYTGGLNIPRVLEDLGGYAADLTKAVYAIQKKVEDEGLDAGGKKEEEPKKAENTSAEQ